MKVLLDANVPHILRTMLARHDVRTAAWEGWAALANGDLIAAAEAAGYDILLTADQNLRYQQNLATRLIAVVVVNSNNQKQLIAKLPMIAQAIDVARCGSFTEVEIV